jgi:hypothetical protein
MSLVRNIGGVLTPQTEGIANWARDDKITMGDRASLFSEYHCPPLQRKLSERHETMFESRYMENFFEYPKIVLIVHNWDCANYHCHQALIDTFDIESVFEVMVISEHGLIVMHMVSGTSQSRTPSATLAPSKAFSMFRSSSVASCRLIHLLCSAGSQSS